MRRAPVIFLTAVAAVLVHALNSRWRCGWLPATVLALAMDAAFVALIVAGRDRILAQRALAGLCSGLCVLASDWVCIRYGGLRYFSGGPFLFLSPLYIPLSFVGAVVQLGEMYEHGARRIGARAAIALTALAGLSYIPLFEYLAKAGRLWRYEGVPMFDDTVPYYILFGELLIGIAIGLTVRVLTGRSFTFALLAGAALGIAIIGSMALGIFLFT